MAPQVLIEAKLLSPSRADYVAKYKDLEQSLHVAALAFGEATGRISSGTGLRSVGELAYGDRQGAKKRM